VDKHHTLGFIEKKELEREQFRQQVKIEGMSPGHSSRPEEPPDEEDDIL
jgi:hypothetical protein